MTSATGGRSMVSSSAQLYRPAELFRADLISAMKLPDSVPMESGSFVTIRDQWRTEWEVGVQVCVSPENLPKIQARAISDPPQYSDDFGMPPTRFTEENTDLQYVQYDLDDLDLNWLESVNQKRKFRALAGSDGLSEETLRHAILTLETKCQQNMAHAVATDVNLGIEYDEHTVCDVCRDHESEDSNDMVFCDTCNVCVHQACYGVLSIPKGQWVCKVCAARETEPSCVLCPNTGGALKRVRPGNSQWAHLSCALWIPEVRVGNVERMEPITNVDTVPMSRKNLVCSVCKKRQGACIQCCHPSCVASFHVTCAFHHGLEMKSRLDMTSNGVIHESFCERHTMMRKSPSRLNSPQHRNHVNRSTQLLQVQESFHKYTSPEDLADELKVPLKFSTLLFNYWKLKRRSLHNRPLLSHLPIETTIESIKAELALGAQYGLNSDQTFLKIIHLRQNLEKARNLVYMAQRRERLKKQLIRNTERIFDAECKLLVEMDEVNGEEDREEEEEEVEVEGGGREEVRSVLEAEDEEDTLQCARQTRSMSSNHKCELLESLDEEELVDMESESIRQTRSMTQRQDQTEDSSTSRSNDTSSHSLPSLSSTRSPPPPHLPPSTPLPSSTCNHTGSPLPTLPVNGPLKFSSESVNSTKGYTTSTSTSHGAPDCPPHRSRKRSHDTLSPSRELHTAALGEHRHSLDTTHLVRKRMRKNRFSETNFTGDDHHMLAGNADGLPLADSNGSDDGPALNLRCRTYSLNKSVKS